MTTPVQRFRAFPLGRRRFIEFEACVVAALVVVALVADDAGGAGEAVAIAAAGYAVGLTAHLALVMLGWAPRGHRRRGPDGR